ncbi:hypothetical protein ACFVYV_46850 [Streptomyces mirabilis]|uniref:hypothetical protein n=1 Tax=Streptomyces mirabilis TaxID=68239 RepID=UPI0036D7C266
MTLYRAVLQFVEDGPAVTGEWNRLHAVQPSALDAPPADNRVRFLVGLHDQDGQDRAAAFQGGRDGGLDGGELVRVRVQAMQGRS